MRLGSHLVRTRRVSANRTALPATPRSRSGIGPGNDAMVAVLDAQSARDTPRRSSNRRVGNAVRRDGRTVRRDGRAVRLPRRWLRRACTAFQRACTAFRRACAAFRRACTAFRLACTAVRRACAAVRRPRRRIRWVHHHFRDDQRAVRLHRRLGRRPICHFRPDGMPFRHVSRFFRKHPWPGAQYRRVDHRCCGARVNRAGPIAFSHAPRCAPRSA